MMIAEEESLKERLIKSISICQKELTTLCSELHVEPFQEEGEPTILQLEKDLRTQVELMRKQKKERKQELKRLQEQDQELCEVLCTPRYDVNNDSVPTLEELNQFRHHVAALRETKASRREEFVDIKRQIILCMEDLDHTPDTSFERDVVCEDEDAFCLSLENIATLQKLLRQLEMRKSQNEAVCEGLRAQIRELWDRLQIPVEEREAVAMVMTGSKAKVKKALQLEVDRLEELKMQNMKKVIEAIRVELAQYWDQCFYSQEQRQAFAPYYDEDYTENLLQLHDAEIVRLRNYYESHKELFEGVQKWEESWRLFLEFEVLTSSVVGVQFLLLTRFLIPCLHQILELLLTHLYLLVLCAGTRKRKSKINGLNKEVQRWAVQGRFGSSTVRSSQASPACGPASTKGWTFPSGPSWLQSSRCGVSGSVVEEGAQKVLPLQLLFPALLLTFRCRTAAGEAGGTAAAAEFGFCS
uniref:Protein regulator of cytokinesis 1 n=1 Tax=Rhinolophus ferrumequinum TaxID=59479 RepID=A0A671G7X4_RHIFE